MEATRRAASVWDGASLQMFCQLQLQAGFEPR